MDLFRKTLGPVKKVGGGGRAGLGGKGAGRCMHACMVCVCGGGQGVEVRLRDPGPG